MEASQRRAVLVGLDGAEVPRVRSALSRLDLDVATAPDARTALAVDPGRPIHGLVVASRLADAPLGSFLRSVREPSSPLRRSGLVVVAPGAACHAVTPFVGRGANRVVALEEVEATLGDTLDRLLRVAPRVRLTAPVRIERIGEQHARRVFCNTVNISSSGMLVRLPYRLPVGAELRFELFLAAGHAPISGSAAVVRHSAPGREILPGIGVMFRELDDEARDRLSHHLTRRSA